MHLLQRNATADSEFSVDRRIPCGGTQQSLLHSHGLRKLAQFSQRRSGTNRAEFRPLGIGCCVFDPKRAPAGTGGMLVLPQVHGPECTAWRFSQQVVGLNLLAIRANFWCTRRRIQSLRRVVDRRSTGVLRCESRTTDEREPSTANLPRQHIHNPLPACRAAVVKKECGRWLAFDPGQSEPASHPQQAHSHPHLWFVRKPAADFLATTPAYWRLVLVLLECETLHALRRHIGCDVAIDLLAADRWSHDSC